jgi:hypothetical protein
LPGQDSERHKTVFNCRMPMAGSPSGVPMSRRECFVHQAAGAADPIVPLIDVLEGIQEIEDRTLWIHVERLRKWVNTAGA